MWACSINESGLFKTIQARLAPVLEGIVELRGRHVLIASDYGGTHKESKYHTFSFLAVDSVFTWLFLDECFALRRTILSDRRMSYKNLNDGKRRRALSDFLCAANTLPGFVVTFAIDKAVGSLFEEDWNSVEQEIPGIQSFKVATSRKLFHIGHLAGVAVCPWLLPGTSLTWLTDDDDFTANPIMIQTSTSALAAILSQHCTHDLGHFRFGAASFVDVGRQSEDLIAIADLCSGAIADSAHLWPELSEAVIPEIGGSLIGLAPKQKAQEVLSWLAYDESFSLKKVVIRLRLTGDSRIAVERLICYSPVMQQFNPAGLLARTIMPSPPA